jgi:NAD(P)-dependent dehydrogenase (short-subunit alcohol dehydrogenase family)
VNVNGRVVLMTGAKRIGQVVACELARRGADVALAYRASKVEAEQTADEVRALGRRAMTYQADVSDPDACDRLVQATVRTFGRLDILVHMASIYEMRPFDTLTAADWEKDLGVNLTSAFLCAKAAIPAMRQNGGGRIINFADWLARSGRPRYPGYLSYYVAKAGVIALTEALALEVASDQILVNAIAPGPVLPPPDMPAEESQKVAANTPVGRWGGEMEVAKAVVALIDTDFITGETIRVDGGRHVR